MNIINTFRTYLFYIKLVLINYGNRDKNIESILWSQYFFIKVFKYNFYEIHQNH